MWTHNISYKEKWILYLFLENPQLKYTKICTLEKSVNSIYKEKEKQVHEEQININQNDNVGIWKTINKICNSNHHEDKIEETIKDDYSITTDKKL